MKMWAIKQIIMGLVITLILGISSGSLIYSYAGSTDSLESYASYSIEEQMASTVLVEFNGFNKGSGFVVASDLIMTAKHVVDERGSYAIIFADGSRRDVKAMCISEESDCAVLQICKSDLVPLVLETKILVGESITVIGSPLGSMKYFNYVTHGIVSKLDVQQDELSSNPVVMIDAAVNPGNSGGPVFNAKGRVIGIAIAMLVYNHGMNFITPSIDIAVLLEEWKNEGPNHNERLEELQEKIWEEFGRVSERCSRTP